MNVTQFSTIKLAIVATALFNLAGCQTKAPVPDITGEWSQNSRTARQPVTFYFYPNGELQAVVTFKYTPNPPQKLKGKYVLSSDNKPIKLKIEGLPIKKEWFIAFENPETLYMIDNDRFLNFVKDNATPAEQEQLVLNQGTEFIKISNKGTPSL